MKLTDLEPRFLRTETRIDTWTRVRPDGTHEEVTGPRQYHIEVDTMAEAQGAMFLCPKCYAANAGGVGTHSVICWFRDRGVPDDAVPGPARWAASGSRLGDLTLSPSVLLVGGCAWHGFITAGQVTSC
jgi:hypothetical protein